MQEPKSPFVFTSEPGAPFTTAGFARMVERAGEAAKRVFKAHPHMLRHACGFALANKGHDTHAQQDHLPGDFDGTIVLFGSQVLAYQGGGSDIDGVRR